MCRFFLEYSGGPPTVPDLQALNTTIDGAYTSHLAAIPTPSVVLKEIDSLDLSSLSANNALDSVSIAGTSTNDDLPAGTAVVVSFKQATRYRGGHSRIYLPFGSSQNLQDDQTWNSSFISGMTTRWEAFITEVSGTTFSGGGISNQVIVHYYKGHTNVLYPSGYYHAIPTVKSPPTFDAVLATIVNKYVGSQRRRNQYVAG